MINSNQIEIKSRVFKSNLLVSLVKQTITCDSIMT